MRVTVNGVGRDLPEGTTVSVVVESLVGVTAGRGVAVAVNDEVVPRTNWAQARLVDGDTIEALTAVPGG